MPYETLRFIHAARLLVDRPLSETGPIGPDLRGLTRGATTQAFRNLVAACLEHDIDFLLLTGDALKRSDHSIKARVELRRGFEELEDAGIQVFLIPGASDPALLWEEFPELPSNVTVFRPEADDPVAVLRDGSVIASIRWLSWRQSWFAWDDEEPHADRTLRRPKEADDVESSFDNAKPHRGALINESDDPELDLQEDQEADPDRAPTRHEARREIRRVQSPADLRPNHFAIAIVRDGVDHPGADPQADYLAVVGGGERTTSKGADWLMHFPGSTQGLSAEEPGLHGCSLVDLDSDGVIRCRFLPTAPVRWENLDLDVDETATLSQLVQRAQAACRDLCGLKPLQEQGRLVAEYGDASEADADDAVLQSEPASSESLHARACFLRWTIRGHGPLFEQLFNEQAQRQFAEQLDDDVHWPLEVPRLHRIRLIASEDVVTRGSSDDDDQLDVPTEYFWRIDQAQPLGNSAWNDLVDERLTRVNAAAAGSDEAVVFSLARRRGWKWFRGANT